MAVAGAALGGLDDDLDVLVELEAALRIERGQLVGQPPARGGDVEPGGQVALVGQRAGARQRGLQDVQRGGIGVVALMVT